MKHWWPFYSYHRRVATTVNARVSVRQDHGVPREYPTFDILVEGASRLDAAWLAERVGLELQKMAEELRREVK